MPTWVKGMNRSYRCDLCGNTWLCVFRIDDDLGGRWAMQCFGTAVLWVDFIGLDYTLKAAKAEALRLVRERCEEIIKATQE